LAGHQKSQRDSINSATLVQIVSGGQTGVDRAALDVAVNMGVKTGGWCPHGRRAEDGRIADMYPLKETPGKKYPQRTKWNVRDSDGTLILTWGPPTGGTALTASVAEQYEKPLHLVDIEPMWTAADLTECIDWINRHQLRVLNVAGPRSSQSPGAYDAATRFLRELVKALLRTCFEIQFSAFWSRRDMRLIMAM
jgi:hypothetical protein